MLPGTSESFMRMGEARGSGWVGLGGNNAATSKSFMHMGEARGSSWVGLGRNNAATSKSFMHMGEARIYRNTLTYGAHPYSPATYGSCPCCTGHTCRMRSCPGGVSVIHRALPMCSAATGHARASLGPRLCDTCEVLYMFMLAHDRHVVIVLPVYS